MPGLLGTIYSRADALKRQVKGLLSDPIGSLQQSVDMALPTEYEAQQGLLAMRGMPHNPEAAKAGDKKLEALALNFNPAAVGHIAYHGSPHKFDKFDLSKIGTGEGAQAYGHGAYLAESPAVAKEYALANAGRAAASDGAIDALPKPVQMEVFKTMQMKDGPFKKATIDDVVARHPETASVFNSKSTNLYKTDIPDEAVARFLDWDKPLSQQSKEVQAAMANVIEKKNPRLAQYLQESAGLDEAGQTAVRKRLGINIFDTIDTGGAAYQAAGQGNVEGLLKSMGVPGIRYLDQGSRSAGQGSSNFVVFDPEMIRILERNGIPTGQVPWKPGEYKGLLSK